MNRERVVIDYLRLNHRLRKEELASGQAQIGYVMGQTTDNQPTSLCQAAKLLTAGVISKIAIPNPLPPYDYGYPGPDYCKQILTKAGVQEDHILTISPSAHLPSMNTQTELEMLARYLEKTKYEANVVIITPWFHLLRSYMTAVSEFKRVGLDTNVFVSSVAFDPYKIVIHSQGIQKGSRREIFYDEVKKCASYPNIMPITEALEIHRKTRDTST